MTDDTTDPPESGTTPPPEERPDPGDDRDDAPPSSVAISPRMAALIAGKTARQHAGRGGRKPHPPADPVQEAIAIRRDGDLVGAIRHLYDALASNLNNSHLYITLATMLAENEEFDRAERIFQRAFAADLDEPLLRLNYATFLAASGRAGAQVAAFRSFGGQIVRELTVVDNAEEGWSLHALFGQWAAADCNLARLRLSENNADAARDLAEKWLVHPETWQKADEVVVGCIPDGEELTTFAELHASQRASPQMVAALVDEAKQDDLGRALAIAAEASAYLRWNWVAEVDGFEADLREILADAGRAADRSGAILRQLLDRPVE